MNDIERAAAESAPQQGITLDALGTVFKMRCDAAEALCITLASQQIGHLAQIERLRAEIERLASALAERDARIVQLSSSETLAEIIRAKDAEIQRLYAAAASSDEKIIVIDEEE